MQRIVFLDVDGPLINTPMFYVDLQCSLKRTVFNTQAIGYVIQLCKIADAKIVMNSTHNTHMINDPLTAKERSIKDDMIYWKVPAELFHENYHTEYPFPRGRKFSDHSTRNRMLSIENWMDDNEEVDWIAFDDEKFTDDFRLILIDFERGIDHAAYKKALKFWELKEPDIFI
jgi:hypothetical protein